MPDRPEIRTGPAVAGVDNGFASRSNFLQEPVAALRVVAATERQRRATMPIILWLLGVPLSLIIILALLGVF